MRRAKIIARTGAAIAMAALCATVGATRAPDVALVVQADSTVDSDRVGLNLGSWKSWGAEQLVSGIVKNPGFEATVDRTVVIVRETGPGWFSDDSPWLGWADDNFRGGTFEVRTGPSAGRRGSLTRSVKRAHDRHPRYFTENDIPLSPGDAVAITGRHDQLDGWWIPPEDTDWIRSTGDTVRPASPGRRSAELRLREKRPTQLLSFFDGITGRAGKLLPIEGEWTLSLWAKASQPGTSLRVSFRRHGSEPFVSRDFDLGKSWASHHVRFTASDGGAPGPLELRFMALGGHGTVHLDDVDLRPSGSGLFRAEVLEVLRELRPGYLRDWQGQLGDTFDNRIATPFARGPVRYRAGVDAYFGYSMADFLHLAQSVDAIPWVIAPTTFDDDEYERLGRFLHEQRRRHGFSEVVVEFGNEHWNSTFRPGSFPDPRTHGQAASRAFAAIAQGAQDPGIRTAIGVQFAAPERATRFVEATKGVDIVAVAPYFATRLAAGTEPTAALRALFPADADRWHAFADLARRRNIELATYEVNLHTLGGDAPPDQRTPLVAGTAAGAALAKQILDGATRGAKRHCVYTLASFDTKLTDTTSLTPLFGVVRDLTPSRRVRPTGLAVAMLNRAMGGALHPLQVANGDDPGMSGAAFHSADGWTAAVVSTSATPRSVELLFPETASAPTLPSRLLVLEGPAPTSTNELREEVRVVDRRLSITGSRARFEIPPWGLVVLAHDATGSLQEKI